MNGYILQKLYSGEMVYLYCIHLWPSTRNFNLTFACFDLVRVSDGRQSQVADGHLGRA